MITIARSRIAHVAPPLAAPELRRRHHDYEDVACACVRPAIQHYRGPGAELANAADEMIVPFAAGGGVDIIARSIAAALSEEFGQRVVVVNRDGAGGTLGFNALAAAPADGYTLVAGPSTPITSAPYLVKGVRYRVNSFDYVCQVFENVFSIAVPANSKFKSARDLLAAAAANPGKLTYGHAGVGQVPHLLRRKPRGCPQN